MALPGISRRGILFASIFLGVLWLLTSSDSPSSIKPPKIWDIYSHGSEPKLVDTSIDVFDFPALDSWVIRDVCESTEWNSSIVFTCDNNHGGVGHVRNSILNCVRYAISAGASLVLPQIALREDEEWNMMEEEPHHDPHSKRHGPGRKGLEYMFDKEHFLHSLRHSCPELKLINDIEQTTGGRRRALLPENLETNHPTTGLEHPDQWRHRFYLWVEDIMPHSPLEERIIVDLEQSFLSYPTHSDGHRFAHSFGNILKFRPDIRRLATTTLKQLGHWYDLHLNLSAPIIPDSFLAAHLHTEDPFLETRDVERRHGGGIRYSDYETQIGTYLAVAQRSNISLIYLASGNQTSIHRSVSIAAARGIATTHKEDLLKGRERDELGRLRWDQRALIDFLVAERAQEFVGVGHSSFSWNVALRRHEFAGMRGVLRGEQPDGVWGDGISGLFGVRRGYVDSSGCMWP